MLGHMKRLSTRKKLTYLSALLAGFFLPIAWLLTVSNLEWADAETTTGTVVAHGQVPRAQGDPAWTRWRYVVEWTDPQGQVRQVESGEVRVPPEVGSQVQVQYYPDDPTLARIAPSTITGPVAAIFGVLGVALLGVAGFLGYRSRQEPPKPPADQPA